MVRVVRGARAPGPRAPGEYRPPPLKEPQWISEEKYWAELQRAPKGYSGVGQGHWSKDQTWYERSHPAYEALYKARKAGKQFLKLE